MGKPVLFVNGNNLADVTGGGSSYLRVHARAARRLGFEPHIFCPAPRDGVSETDFGIVHLVASPFRPFGALTVALHTPRLAASVKRFLSTREGPHLIHCMIWLRIGLIARRRLGRKGVKVVAVNGLYTTADSECSAKVRGLSEAHGIRQRLRYQAEMLWTSLVVEREERQVYHEADLLTYNYDSVRRLFQERHGEGAEMRKLPYTSESAFLYEGVEIEAHKERPIAAPRLANLDAPLIIAVSRHDPRKGVDTLLRALAILRESGAIFRACLIGHGPLLEPHRKLARRLELDDVVTITGWVPDPFDYLRHADIFVLPSLQEGSGSLSLIEALQAGLLIVASNVDGIPEDVTDGDSALLVPPGDAIALSHTLWRALTDPNLRIRLRRRARETFVEKFSAEAFTNALQTLYAELGFNNE